MQWMARDVIALGKVCSSVVIGLAEAYRRLLAEPKERCTQQGNCQDEKAGSTVEVL